MILFEKVKWKNFLSTGDKFTEIDLNNGESTLIVGANGSGKSTLLDAIAFALFGKPHRDIKKNQIVNSINNKDCVVEVEFSLGNNHFRVIRGIKPNVFEIWQNDQLLNQESHTRDYQKILEQNILKLNHKSFHQIVMLGSSSFIPFMQLPAQHRREVIEDLLDINIFTKMNQLLKEKSSTLKDQISELGYEADVIAEKVRMQYKYIADLKNLDKEQDEKRQEKITILEEQVDTLLKKNQELTVLVEENYSHLQKQLDESTSLKQKLLSNKSSINTDIAAIVKEAKFYDSNDECPTCAQPIDLNFKKDKIHKCKSKASQLAKDQATLEKTLEEVNKSIAGVTESINDGKTFNTEILTNNVTIRNLQKQIKELEKEASTKKNIDLEASEKELQTLTLKQTEIGTQKNSLYEESTYNQAIAEMLKDTGIKTKVIKQYLPVMNKLINQYLQTLDFFVSFHLNESFEETIKSRHRDDFSYSSFSEGEKQRIDLALLFTWRQVAKMKNSVSTNLLILDETFDSSLDSDGVDNLLRILQTLDENTSVFVISHKTDILDGKFKNKIEFYKEKNFSFSK